MLKELRFVQGAVSTKSLIPAMTHFRIENGTVRSFNGRLALCSPIALDIQCNPEAARMVKAIGQCDEVPTLSLTESKQLRIVSGRFHVTIPNIEGDTVHPNPEGDTVPINGEAFIAACKLLYPFIGNDASRRWTNGILLNNMSAFATNNTCLIEYWMGVPVPVTLNVPREAIKEVLRIGEPPVAFQIAGRSMTLHYSDKRWIRTQLLDITWPDLTKILDQPNNPVPLPEEFFDGIRKLQALDDKASRIYIKDGALLTNIDEPEKSAGYKLPGVPFTGCYPTAMLALLEGVVTKADMTLYPKPCVFYGERLRGAIIGMRMAHEGQAFSNGVVTPSGSAGA